MERCQDRAECFNADLKADWERWQSDKRRDFRELLTGLADRNIAHYEKVERQRGYDPPVVGPQYNGLFYICLLPTLQCQAAWESLVQLLQDKQSDDTASETN